MLISDRPTTARRITDFISYSGGTDRVTLGTELGMPMPTVISAVKRLLAEGVVVESGDTRTRAAAGRRPRILLRSGPPSALGLIRWGADSLEAAGYDFSGAKIDSRSLPIPEPAAGAAGLNTAIDAVRSMIAEQRQHQLLAVVVSVPAPFLHGQGAPQLHHPHSDATPAFSVAVGGDLERTLTRDHGIPVLMENDANLAALGELYAGAAAGARNAVYLKINEQGFGSAIIVNGALARGAHGFAGELAHLQIDPDGPLCACGGRGCLRSHVQALISQSAQAAFDEPITFGDLSRLAADDDPGAARMLTDIGRTVGRPLAHLCTFLDPEQLIVDDTIGPAVEHILAGLRETFTVQAPPVIAHDIALRVGTLGAQAEIRGAIESLRESARHG